LVSVGDDDNNTNEQNGSINMNTSNNTQRQRPLQQPTALHYSLHPDHALPIVVWGEAVPDSADRRRTNPGHRNNHQA
jgi:hypothetical protein